MFGQLLQAGLRAEAIAVCDEDTYRNGRDFFSYRRDKITGPHGRISGNEGDSNGMNRLFLIIGIAIMIAALVFLSQGIKKASPTDKDLEQQYQDAQQEAQKKAEEAQKKSAPPAAAGKPSAATDALPAEETVGNPATAQHHIQVGWVYDEGDQASPEILTGPLQVIRGYVQSSHGTVSAEIVNLDIPTADRSPAAQAVTDSGVSVDGKPVLPGSFSTMHVKAPDITKALDGEVGKK